MRAFPPWSTGPWSISTAAGGPGGTLFGQFTALAFGLDRLGTGTSFQYQGHSLEAEGLAHLVGQIVLVGIHQQVAAVDKQEE